MMRRTTLLAAVAALVATIGVAGPAEAGTAFKVTAKIAGSYQKVDEPTVVSGTVTPRAPVVKVYAKAGGENAFHLMGDATVTSSGAYSLGFFLPDSGDATIRVKAVATAKNDVGYADLATKVFGWVPITDLPSRVVEAGAAQNFDWENSEGTYVDSLRLKSLPGGSNARVRYDLRNQCTSYRGEGGFDDAADPGAFGQGIVFTTGSNGSTVLTSGIARSASAGDAPYSEVVPLQRKNAAGTLLRGRFIKFSVQTDPSQQPWGYRGQAYCNLPGAELAIG